MSRVRLAAARNGISFTSMETIMLFPVETISVTKTWCGLTPITSAMEITHTARRGLSATAAFALTTAPSLFVPPWFMSN